MNKYNIVIKNGFKSAKHVVEATNPLKAAHTAKRLYAGSLISVVKV